MFKKFAIAAPLALLAMSSTAFAAGEASHSISLVATVPTTSFFVVPVDPDLVNKDQDMSYNPATGKMTEVKGYFDGSRQPQWHPYAAIGCRSDCPGR
jgi:hypothetical protein